MVKPLSEKHILNEIKNLSLKIMKPDRWVIALSGALILSPILPSIVTLTVIGAIATNFFIRPFLEMDFKNNTSKEVFDTLSKKLLVNLAKTFLAFVPPLMISTYIVGNAVMDINKQKNSILTKIKNIPKNIREAIIGKETSPLEDLGNNIHETFASIGDSIKEKAKELFDPLAKSFSNSQSNNHRAGKPSDNSRSGRK